MSYLEKAQKLYAMMGGGANYSSHFFGRKLAFNLGGQYTSRFFGAGNMDRVTGNGRVSGRSAPMVC
jgi:hypothetical protein